MRKVGLIGIAIVICLLSISAKADGLKWTEVFESEEVSFQKMHTTAYCVGKITNNGSKVHVGGCACNPHVGEIAIVYTLEGEYLGTFECNDTGSSEGLRAGTVIDMYFPSLEECKDWMKKTQGKVMVQWVEGQG